GHAIVQEPLTSKGRNTNKGVISDRSSCRPSGCVAADCRRIGLAAMEALIPSFECRQAQSDGDEIDDRSDGSLRG
ncbi:MAG: hypothetical protein ACK56G_09975, partial [Pirellulaceae bacterium]